MSALKKPECKDNKTNPKNPSKKVNYLNLVDDDKSLLKIEIESMKKIITEKIKDPALARKAAMIISEMLDKK